MHFFSRSFDLQVPAYETKDGKFLFESNAIAYYVANDQLRGKSDFEQAQVIQWLSFAESEILPYASAWVFPLLGFMPYNKNTLERAKEDTERTLNVLNSYLLNRTYLVGERISLADIVAFANLLSLYKYVLEPTVRNQFGNLNRWFNTILHQPQVSKIVSNFQLADKAIEFDPKRYAEIQAKTGGGAAKSQKKEQQPQQQQPKKEKKEKKSAAKKEAEPAEELDAADLALAAEPKSKDPFAELPPGMYNNNNGSLTIFYFLFSLLIISLLLQVHSITMTSNVSIQMKKHLFPPNTFGKNSIRQLIQFGLVNINTMMN